MDHVFLYGTLRHAGLLELVLGHMPPEARMQAAKLEGHAVSRARGHGFPLIHKREGAAAEGILLRDVDAAERARLDHYELGFGYHLQELEIAGEPVLVYFPEAGLWEAAEPWSLEQWSAQDWPHVQYSAAEIMGYIDHVAAHDLAWRFPMIAARAHSKYLASLETPPDTLRAARGATDVDVLEREVMHLGFFRTDAYKLQHRRHDGSMSGTLQREVFVAADAALVLPYDPASGRVMLVEQFRMGPLARGDKNPWVLEPIAGRIDAGETPEAAARRECLEETGLDIRSLVPAGGCYPSPGEVSTYFHLFVGLADLPDNAAGLGGLETEQEDIKSHVVSLTRAQELVESGEINIGPLVQLLQWLLLHKSALDARA
ncbi:NUDIX domain-containing protein [Lentibacter algarum]|uniref:NUDIX domain-containing protein n=1 Tax=Lentibacter algarum TaxID=576131 RepID=UPI001C06FDA5|nr:NUDIX domain-containing protein [Lentibacter algarum]MBU2982259.1 NUDIX domain-containing protein [Lentibacter algarum]